MALFTTQPPDLRAFGDVTWFQPLNRRKQSRVLALGHRRQVAPGTKLLVEQTPGTEVLLVLSGYASCSIGQTALTIFGPGDFFGEVAALDGGLRTATVTAISPMEALVLPAEDFSTLLAEVPSLAFMIAKTLALRIRQANERVAA